MNNTTKPYDLNVSNDELNLANNWWRNLSNNQMDEFQRKYFQHWQQAPHKRMIHQIWEAENKPEPQKLIPICE